MTSHRAVRVAVFLWVLLVVFVCFLAKGTSAVSAAAISTAEVDQKGGLPRSDRAPTRGSLLTDWLDGRTITGRVEVMPVTGTGRLAGQELTFSIKLPEATNGFFGQAKPATRGLSGASDLWVRRAAPGSGPPTVPVVARRTRFVPPVDTRPSTNGNKPLSQRFAYDAPHLSHETRSLMATKPAAGAAADPFTKLANGGGPTIKVVTSLDSAPVAGRPLSVSVGGDGLAKAANASGTLYEAALPKALVDELVYKGLAQQKVTSMGGVTGTEIRFYPGATQYIVDFFKAAK